MLKSIVWITLAYLMSAVVVFGLLFRQFPQVFFSSASFIGIISALLFMAVIWVGLLFFLVWNVQKNTQRNLRYTIDRALHELKIPVATIRANIQMLLSQNVDEATKRKIERIAQATRRLEKLYKEVSYALKEEGDKIEKECFDAHEVIQDRIRHFRGLSRQTIRYEGEETLIYADKIGFIQVVDNLIDNAMKYSPKESEIFVEMKREVLRIRDQGIGIAKKELVKIFESYYQQDTGRGGVGLGLHIVKRYCDAHRIAIEIASQPQEGTAFFLRLEKLRCQTLKHG